MNKETKHYAVAFRISLLLAFAALTQIGTSRLVCAQTATPTPTPLWKQSGANISNTNSGNVGIGTSTPAANLDVKGSSVAVRATMSGTTGANGKFQIYSSDIINNPFGEMQLYAPTGAGSEYLRFNLGNSSGAIFADLLTINRRGAVGIGTASPAYQLDVQGGQVNASGGLCIAGICKGSWSEVGGGNQWATGASGISYGSGSVGVGTSSPSGKFEVAGGSIFLGDMGRPSWGNMIVRGRVFSSNSNIHLSPPGGATVYINSDFREAGGTTGAVNLEVSGTISAGNIQARYQDVAEWVPSTQELQAGTVVVLDVKRVNHVAASSSSYDTTVAGVVSEQPGVILGEAGKGKLKVATTGRVKVRVDASRGAIHVGDLLVTSEIPGLAMKSEPIIVSGRRLHAPGTIIGKALEPLESGTGEILVLLSLQ